MADVKELIPEFFYLPDFLTNDNRFILGVKQNEEKLNDILLPPWAKGDPREFIRMHREVSLTVYSTAIHTPVLLIIVTHAIIKFAIIKYTSESTLLTFM